jgi:hypothetical protein
LTSVEALGWWPTDSPRTGAHRHFVETRLLLDSETNERLLYLSKRFNVPKPTLLRELVRAAVKDISAVIPGDPLPTEPVLDLRGAGVDSERLWWFEVESVKDIAGSGWGADWLTYSYLYSSFAVDPVNPGEQERTQKGLEKRIPNLH